MTPDCEVIQFDDEPVAPKPSVSSSLGPEPFPIVFEDTPTVNTPTSNTPSADRGPTVVSFGDTPAPAPKPKATPAAPQVATFEDKPAPAAAPASVPAPKRAPAPAAAVFDPSTPPARQPAPVLTTATPAFGGEPPLSEQAKRALDYVRQNAAELFQRAPQEIEGAIRNLLPFSLETLSRWGDTALQDNAKLVKDMSDLQRGFSALNVSETVQQALDSRKGPKNIFQRMVSTTPVDLNTFRVRAVGLNTQIDLLIPQVEALKERGKAQASRLSLLLTAMSAAASVGASRLDPAVDIALQNRRTVLTQSSQQSQLILPQIEEIRRQLVEQSAQITQFINVTLPAMDLADAQAPHHR